jgi:hypothetical protein
VKKYTEGEKCSVVLIQLSPLLKQVSTNLRLGLARLNRGQVIVSQAGLVSWTLEMVHQLSLLIVGHYEILAIPKAPEVAHQHHQTLLVLLRSPGHFAKPIQHVSLLGRFCVSV